MRNFSIFSVSTSFLSHYLENKKGGSNCIHIIQNLENKERIKRTGFGMGGLSRALCSKVDLLYLL